MDRYSHFIDGALVPPSSGVWFDTENPFTQQPWTQIAQGNTADVDVAVKAAHKAFTSGPWKEMTASQRGLVLHRFGDVIAKNAKRLAEIEVRDNGKLFAEMFGQINYIPQWFYYFGGLAERCRAPSCRSTKRAT